MSTEITLNKISTMTYAAIQMDDHTRHRDNRLAHL